MNKLKNDRSWWALLRQQVHTIPVSMMRQAGCCLPEYRDLTARTGSFVASCKHPDWVCEVTFQPLQCDPLEVAISFSDIWTLAEAIGLGLEFTANEGPFFAPPIRQKSEILKLRLPEPEQTLGDGMDTIHTVRKNPAGGAALMGFAGSRWTPGTYMIEGGSSKNASKIKKMRYQESKTLHTLLETLTEVVALYLNAQICAGAQAVMIFDTWGAAVSHRDYGDFSLSYRHEIVRELIGENEGRVAAVTLFIKGAGQRQKMMSNTGCDAISLDGTTPIGEARGCVGDKVALQGNLDPACLYASPERVEKELESILNVFGPGCVQALNLVQGSHSDIPPENVAFFVEAVHPMTKFFHSGCTL